MCATNVTNDDYPYDDVSQEYETQIGDDNLDMDDEGFVMKGRTANYTNKEDVLICTAWKKVSQDATVGTDQSAVTYWQRIKEFFDARNTSGHQRSSDSIRQRWGTINAECQKWARCLANVERMNPSGYGESDLVIIICYSCVHSPLFDHQFDDDFFIFFVENDCARIVSGEEHQRREEEEEEEERKSFHFPSLLHGAQG